MRSSVVTLRQWFYYLFCCFCRVSFFFDLNIKGAMWLALRKRPSSSTHRLLPELDGRSQHHSGGRGGGLKVTVFKQFYYYYGCSLEIHDGTRYEFLFGIRVVKKFICTKEATVVKRKCEICYKSTLATPFSSLLLVRGFSRSRQHGCHRTGHEDTAGGTAASVPRETTRAGQIATEKGQRVRFLLDFLLLFLLFVRFHVK